MGSLTKILLLLTALLYSACALSSDADSTSLSRTPSRTTPGGQPCPNMGPGDICYAPPTGGWPGISDSADCGGSAWNSGSTCVVSSSTVVSYNHNPNGTANNYVTYLNIWPAPNEADQTCVTACLGGHPYTFATVLTPSTNLSVQKTAPCPAGHKDFIAEFVVLSKYDWTKSIFQRHLRVIC